MPRLVFGTMQRENREWVDPETGEYGERPRSARGTPLHRTNEGELVPFTFDRRSIVRRQNAQDLVGQGVRGVKYFSGSVGKRLTDQEINVLEYENKLHREAYEDTHRDVYKAIEYSRRYDPTQLNITELAAQSRGYQQWLDEARLAKSMGKTVPSPGSPFARLNKAMPGVGNIFKHYERWRANPTNPHARALMEEVRQNTAMFMERVGRAAQSDLPDTEFQRSVNEEDRQSYIEAYDTLVAIGAIGGGQVGDPGTLTPSAKRFLKISGKTGMGRPSKKFSRRARQWKKARDPHADVMYRQALDELGNPVEIEEEGPLEGMPKLSIVPADILYSQALAQATARSLAIGSAQQQLIATKKRLAEHEREIKGRWRDEGWLGVHNDEGGKILHEPNARGNWTLSDPRFKEAWKNDTTRQDLQRAIQDLERRSNAQENAGQRLNTRRRAMGGPVGGPLMARLASAKALKQIQELYDLGRIDEAQSLQKSVEQMRGGWPGAKKGMDRRAMGGPLRAANGMVRQLAPHWASGQLGELAEMPGAVLVGEHGPEVMLDGNIYPNHFNGVPLPQFHAGGGYGPHQHPHRSDREGRDVFFSERTGRWHLAGDPERFGGQPMVRGPIGGGDYPTRSQRERAQSRIERTGQLFGPNEGSGHITRFEAPASADPLNDPRVRREYQYGLVDRWGQAPRTSGVVMPDDRTVQAHGQLQMFGPIGAYAQPPVQGITQANQPVAVGGQPPPPPSGGGGGGGGGGGQPPPGGGGQPPAAGPRPPRVARLPAASPAQRQRGFIAAQTNLQDLFQQIEQVRIQASDALQLTPVRALSVSLGQQFQERFGGRRDIRAREAVARGAAGEAQQIASRLQSQLGAYGSAREQFMGLSAQARELRRMGQPVSPEMQAQINVARTQAAQARMGTRVLRPQAQEALLRAQILERGERQVTRERPQDAQQISRISGDLRAAGQDPRGILQRSNILRAQGIGLVGILAGTKLFTAGIQVVDAGLGLLSDALHPAVDALTGFTTTTNTLVKQMSDAARQSGGGAFGAVAGMQAQMGISFGTPELVRRSQMMAGAENLLAAQEMIRAEQNAGGRSRLQGVTTGFDNGMFSGVPVLEDILGWVGQTKGITELMRGTIGPRPTEQVLPITDLVNQIVGSPTLDQFLKEEERRLMSQGRFMSRDDQAAATTRYNELYPGGGGGGGILEGGAAKFDRQIGEWRQRVSLQFEQVNSGIAKIDPAIGQFLTGVTDNAEAVEATAAAIEPFDADLAQLFRDAGVVLADKFGKAVTPEVIKDAFGNAISSDVTDALAAALEGSALQDPTKLLDSMNRQLQAQIRGILGMAEFQRTTMIPAQLSRQLAVQPLPTSGMQGLAPTTPLGIGTGASSNPGMLQEYATVIEGLRGDLEAMALSDFELRERLGVDQQTLDSVRDTSNLIREYAEIDQDLQLGQEQEQYNEQLRISRRHLGDLVGIVGRESAAYRTLVQVQEDGTRIFGTQVSQATEFGQLTRANIVDQRTLTAISQARSQREINLQLALARMTAPGETPQERAVRQREAELLAREAQRELTINRRVSRRGFRLEDVGNQRALQDALAQQGLAESGRTIDLRVRGSQAIQQVLQQILETKAGTLDLAISVGAQIEQAVLETEIKLQEASNQFSKDFSGEIRSRFDVMISEGKRFYSSIFGGDGEDKDVPQWESPGLGKSGNTGTQYPPRPKSGGDVWRGETPDTGGPGGSRGMSVTVNIVNPSVRDDRDIDNLARKVVRLLHEEARTLGVS
jgi:hypothetical protein